MPLNKTESAALRVAMNRLRLETACLRLGNCQIFRDHTAIIRRAVHVYLSSWVQPILFHLLTGQRDCLTETVDHANESELRDVEENLAPPYPDGSYKQLRDVVEASLDLNRRATEMIATLFRPGMRVRFKDSHSGSAVWVVADSQEGVPVGLLRVVTDSGVCEVEILRIIDWAIESCGRSVD